LNPDELLGAGMGFETDERARLQRHHQQSAERTREKDFTEIFFLLDFFSISS
jgi:hypothetical protein